MQTAIDLIHQERARQLGEEGWTAEHDDEHGSHQLLDAARAYIGAATDPAFTNPGRPPVCWPWDVGSWKPSEDPIRNLVKAGALIAAEVDRLTRLNA
jgi:hypothetical protein